MSKVPSLEELQKTADQITNMYRQAGSQMDDDDDGNLRGNVRKMRLIVSCKEDAKYLRSNLVKKKFMGNNMMPIFDSNLILQGWFSSSFPDHHCFFLTLSFLLSQDFWLKKSSSIRSSCWILLCNFCTFFFFLNENRNTL